MKTRVISKALLSILVAIAAFLSHGGAGEREAHAQVAATSTLAASANASPLGSVEVPRKRDCGSDCISIELGTAASELRSMGSKDAADQLRDWAVYGTLAQLGLDKNAVGQATLHMAPLRLPYVEAAYRFDYGRGRRVLFGNRVAFFYDQDDPDPRATLGRLADRVRMETGEQLDVPLVFSIEPDLPWGRILVRKRAAISAKDLFGPAYGYFESDVQSVAELQNWLQQVDDVTFAVPISSKLRLGGRRAAVKRTLNINVEDVAAIWQAQRKLGVEHTASKAKFEREALDRARQQFPIEFMLHGEELRQRLSTEFEKQWSKVDAPAPGFSLDPTWNTRGLAETLEQVAKDPCSLLPQAAEVLRQNRVVDETATPYLVQVATGLPESSAKAGKLCGEVRPLLEPDLRRMAAGVRQASQERDPKLQREAVDTAMIPIFSLMARDGDGEAPPMARQIARFLKARHHMQCARYDGPLAGTNVGMTLFYADLLAKFWESVDYHAAAPGLAVPGFKSAPRVNVPATFRQDLQTKSSTRIWFAPNQQSYALLSVQKAEPGKLFFEHVATKIFAAGSDPTSPGKEAEPAEDGRRTIGWWNRHYGEVAEYEPRYQAQNQIIKWSLITAWANERLGFLAQQPVDNKLTFDAWLVRERPRLRYQHPVDLRPKADWPTPQTECMDLLASYDFESYGSLQQISGGVSLGGKGAMREAGVVNSSRPLWQRVTVPPPAPGTTKVAWTPVRPVYEQGKVKVAGATLRGNAVDGGQSTLTTSFEVVPNKRVAVILGTDHGRIGTLRADTEPGAVQLSWAPGLRAEAVKAAQSSVTWELPAGTRPPIKLESKLSTYVHTDDGLLEVQRIGRSTPAPKDVLARAESSFSTSVVTLKKPAELNKLADGSKWQRLSLSEEGGGQQLALREFGSSDLPASARKLQLDNVPGFAASIEVRVDSRGHFWIPRPRDDVSRAVWRDLDVRSGLTAEGLSRVERAASGGAARVDYSTLVGKREKAVEQALARTARGDLAAGRAALKSVGENAEQRRSIARAATSDGDAALLGGQARRAQDLYQLASDTGLAPPELGLRQALSEIQAGRPASGLARLSTGQQLPGELLSLIQRAPGLDDVSMVISARARPTQTILGESPSKLGLSVTDGGVFSTLKLSGEVRGERLTPAQVTAYVKEARDAEIYIDDGFSLNRQDFEASFDGSVAEFARMPHVSWREASATESRYLPSRVVESKGGRYWRATSRGGDRSPSVLSNSRRTRILFIKNCDTDRDGALSAGEKEAC